MEGNVNAGFSPLQGSVCCPFPTPAPMLPATSSGGGSGRLHWLEELWALLLHPLSMAALYWGGTMLPTSGHWVLPAHMTCSSWRRVFPGVHQNQNRYKYFGQRTALRVGSAGLCQGLPGAWKPPSFLSGPKGFPGTGGCLGAPSPNLTNC